jgi:uncharacterized membrane protein
METKSTSIHNSSENFSDTERWGSLITGGALVLSGLSQRSLRGALMAIAGGTLAYHGVAGQKGLQDTVTEATGIDKPLRVEKTVTIQNKSAAELYQFWHDFENLPTFMKHLRSVTVLDDTRSHWVANAPLGNTVEWEAQIINDLENLLISWASIPGAAVENSGFVRFQAAPPGRGTEVKVVLEYTVPGGILTAAIAKVFGENPEQQIGDDLRRFKMLMETGELATTEGQSAGQR